MDKRNKPNGGACLVAAAWIVGSLVAFAVVMGIVTVGILIMRGVI